MRSHCSIAVTVLVSLPYIASVRADDTANNVPVSPFRAAPGWVAATGPLTIARRRIRDVEASPTRRAEPPSDGTWREEGGYVILNLGGREFRLRKAENQAAPASQNVARTSLPGRPETERKLRPQSAKPDGGAVEGRLLNHRRPLVNCTVELIPLQPSFLTYTINADARPLTTTTDAHGHYRFDSVAPGPYKLRWLPAGRRRWIRRLEIKPDVIVRDGCTAHAKTVRVALSTIN